MQPPTLAPRIRAVKQGISVLALDVVILSHRIIYDPALRFLGHLGAFQCGFRQRRAAVSLVHPSRSRRHSTVEPITVATWMRKRRIPPTNDGTSRRPNNVTPSQHADQERFVNFNWFPIPRVALACSCQTCLLETLSWSKDS